MTLARMTLRKKCECKKKCNEWLEHKQSPLNEYLQSDLLYLKKFEKNNNLNIKILVWTFFIVFFIFVIFILFRLFKKL